MLGVVAMGKENDCSVERASYSTIHRPEHRSFLKLLGRLMWYYCTVLSVKILNS